MAATTAAVIGAAATAGSAIDQRRQTRRAQESQEEQTAERQAFTEQQLGQARSDVTTLFPEAQRVQQRGFQGALDIFGQAVPEQARLFQGGNVAAQEQLLAGLPQIQRAILGLPTDFGTLRQQPQTFDFGSILAGQQAPDATQFLTQFGEQTRAPDQSQQAQEAIANQTDQAIIDLYRELLGRDPDPSGLAFSRGIVAPSGLTSPGGIERLRGQIMGSTEFRQRQQQQTAPAGNFPGVV